METWIKDIPSRVERFKSFHRRDNERPLFGFFRGSDYPLFRYAFSKGLPEGRPLVPADFDIAAFVSDCRRLFEAHEACGGDFIYAASAFWGIPWLEAALGCPIFADHGTGSIRSEPPPGFQSGQIPEFSAANPWVRLMSDMLDALAVESAGQFPLATTRMRGIADLLAALHGGEQVVLAMFEEPDVIRQEAERLTDFFIGIGRAQLARIPEFHDGIGSFYYHAWMPRGTVWHQEDAAALLSPTLYGQFIEPCDRRIVEAFDQVVMHQHSTGFVPTANYLDMGMSVLELHIDTGGPSAESLFRRHLGILERVPLIIWGDISESDLDWIFQKLPPQGLAVITVVENPAKAHLLWRRYAER